MNNARLISFFFSHIFHQKIVDKDLEGSKILTACNTGLQAVKHNL